MREHFRCLFRFSSEHLLQLLLLACFSSRTVLLCVLILRFAQCGLPIFMLVRQPRDLGVNNLSYCSCFLCELIKKTSCIFFFSELPRKKQVLLIWFKEFLMSIMAIISRL